MIPSGPRADFLSSFVLLRIGFDINSSGLYLSFEEKICTINDSV
jgi:hypothetical protein